MTALVVALTSLIPMMTAFVSALTSLIPTVTAFVSAPTSLIPTMTAFVSAPTSLIPTMTTFVSAPTSLVPVVTALLNAATSFVKTVALLVQASPAAATVQGRAIRPRRTPMYRASHDSFAGTIERLEAEVRELRALRAPGRPRDRALWATTGIAVVGALLAVAACGAARSRAADAERRFDAARVRLERKTNDLAACEELAYKQLRVDRD